MDLIKTDQIKRQEELNKELIPIEKKLITIAKEYDVTIDYTIGSLILLGKRRRPKTKRSK